MQLMIFFQTNFDLFFIYLFVAFYYYTTQYCLCNLNEEARDKESNYWFNDPIIQQKNPILCLLSLWDFSHNHSIIDGEIILLPTKLTNSYADTVPSRTTVVSRQLLNFLTFRDYYKKIIFFK